MNKKKILVYIIRYFVYLPFTNRLYRKSLLNLIIFKVLYESKRYLTFFDSLSVHSSFSSLLIDRLIEKEKIVIFVGDETHPALDKKNDNLIVVFLDRKFKILFLLLKIPILITFSSGWDKRFKPKNMHLIHLPHSMVSLTHIYSNGSFDAYNTIFMVGPHHKKELEFLSKIRSWEYKNFIEIGYPKIEQFTTMHIEKVEENIILFAPSWGKTNILKSNGIEIIQSVLELGYKIIVRPHPLSFLNDINTIEQIKLIVKTNPNCILEDSNFASMDSYIKSKVMISDWSGAAYEYVFGLLKPVLFIDGPMKIGNDSEDERVNFPMEYTCRERVGKVTNMKDFKNNLMDIVKQTSWEEKLIEVRKDYLYNSVNSIDIVLNNIDKIRKEVNA